MYFPTLICKQIRFFFFFYLALVELDVWSRSLELELKMVLKMKLIGDSVRDVFHNINMLSNVGLLGSG